MEEINLKDLFNYFIKKYLIIVITLLTILIGGTIYSTLIKKPMYKSNVNIVLATENTDYNQNELTFNQKLVGTYSKIITSKKVLNQVIQNLNLKYSYEDLKDLIKVTSESNTEFIVITVESKNNKEACNIANAIVPVFSEEIKKIYNISNVSLLDEATVAENPYNKNIIKEEVIYTAIGLVLGSGIVFMMFYFDTTIKSKEEIENKYNISVIGTIPMTNENMLSRKTNRSYLSESIRLIKTNIGFSSFDKEIKTILVTSPMPNDGKSFVASNLACAYAQAGLKVLLLEGDLREGLLSKTLGVRNSNGYSTLILDYKSKKLDLSNYVKETKVENLYVITRGVTPPNPVELLNSDNNKGILEKLKKEFDLIIVDSTPVIGLSDALITSKNTDYNIVVVSSNQTKEDDLNDTINLFNKNSLKIDGIVMNKVNNKSLKSSHYYYYSNKYYKR